MEPWDPENTEAQARYQQLRSEAELPDNEQCFQLAAAGLASAGAQPYTSTPSIINETLPEDMEIAERQPLVTRDLQLSDITDITLYNSSLQVQEKRFIGAIFGVLLGGIVNVIIDEVLQAVCPVCHEVYDFYTKISDPFYLVEQICEPCRPALEIRAMITDPVGYAKDVLDWYFEYGKYDPQGSRTPPPRPSPPPPIQAASRVSASLNMQIPPGAKIENRDPWNNNPDLFLCLDCNAVIANIVVYGTVAVNIQQKRVEKSTFTIDMSIQSRSYIHMKIKAADRYRGSTAVGSRYVGSVSSGNLFSFDITYTHWLIYDVGSAEATDVKFGIDSSTFGGHAIVDIGFGRIDSQAGWRTFYNVLYPTLGFSSELDGSITTQGVVSINMNILGTPYREDVIATSTSLSIRTRVILATDSDAGKDGHCAIGETELDSWIGGNTRIMRTTVNDVNAPLGRRCLRLKSLAMTNAPIQPYCGFDRMPGGNFTWQGQPYIVECNKQIKRGPTVALTQRTFVGSFLECIDMCNTQKNCAYARWEWRRVIYTCLLYSKGDIITEDSYFNAYAAKVLPPDPPTSTITSSATPKPTCSGRCPIMHTTLTPPRYPPFTMPTEAPAPPLPTDYPPRNPEGFCDGLQDGNYTAGVVPREVDFDVQCGTTIDWTGILLTGRSDIGFADCMIACRFYGTDCQGIMMNNIYSQRCAIIHDISAQRYSTGEDFAIAIKKRVGTGLAG